MTLKIEAEEGADIEIAEAFLSRARGTIRATRGCRLRIGHPVHIDERTSFDFNLTASGHVEIGEGCYFGILSIHCDGSSIFIGSDTTCYEVKLRAFGGRSIRIGKDCMLAGNVEVDTSDFHTLFDERTGEVLNRAKDVSIGDHVWIANHSHVLKGSVIESGSVIGARSLVAGNIPGKCIAVGSPAKPIRFNIGWSRSSPDVV